MTYNDAFDWAKRMNKKFNTSQVVYRCGKEYYFENKNLMSAELAGVSNSNNEILMVIETMQN